MTPRSGSTIQKAFTILLLLAPVGFGQQQAAPLLSPDQLDNLVAPIALYPDPLLSQTLAASTYPLEIVEAQQWLRQNGNLQGGQLMDAARQQNWDPSVQALVAFPEAMRLLSSDVRWTTDLGNAFLAQQADVMSAVQRMRERARANGRLSTTPQQIVTSEFQDGQNAVEILPADQRVIYVPVYQPAYVWGPPVWDAYPDLWYGGGFGFGFGPSIYVGGFFPGWYGWAGWGWGCGWSGRDVFVNAGFFNRYGFRGGGRGFAGRGAWAHDPGHRMGVPYANPAVAGRFNSGRFNRGGTTGGQFGGVNRAGAGQWTGGRFNGGTGGSTQLNRGSVSAGSIGSRSATAGGRRSFNGDNRTAARSYQGSTTRQASPNYGASAGSGYRGTGSTPGYRGAPSYSRSSASVYSAPRQSYSAPRSFSSAYSAPRPSYATPRSFSAPTNSVARQSYSAPRSFAPAYSAPRQNYSAPRSFSAPHYSGGQAGGGGGHYAGGGRVSGGGGHANQSGGRRR